MTRKRTLGAKTFDTINTLIMLFLIFITVYPLLYVVFASLSDPLKLLKHEGFLWGPLGTPTLKGYKLTFANQNIWIGYRNTLFYVGAGTFINLVMTSLGAYVVTRENFKIKKPLLVLVTVTMFFSGGLIPNFILVRTLGIYDTVWPIIIPGAISTWNLMIMKTFFQNLPKEMEESALLDGANDWQIFTRITLPLSKAVIAVMILYYGVGHWNSWFNASIYLRDRSLYPLQLFLRESLMLNNSTSGATSTANQMREESIYRELVQYCTIIMATVPILVVYPFLQKYFVQGVMIGAIKG